MPLDLDGPPESEDLFAGTQESLDLDGPPDSEDLFAGTQGSLDLDCPPESEDLFAGTQWPTDAPVPGPCNLSPLRKGWRRKANKLSFSVLNDRETEAYKPKAPNKLVSVSHIKEILFHFMLIKPTLFPFRRRSSVRLRSAVPR